MLGPDHLSCAVLLTEEWGQCRVMQIRSGNLHFNFDDVQLIRKDLFLFKRGSEKVKMKISN